MIEIGLEAWGTLLAVLCIGLGGEWFEKQMVPDEAPLVHLGTLLFILWGFLLLAGELVLLILAKDNLAKMTEKNHHIRTEMEGDRWEEYDEHHAILESELRALMLALAQKENTLTLTLPLTLTLTLTLPLTLTLTLTLALTLTPSLTP